MTTNTIELCGAQPQQQKTVSNYTLWTVQVLLALLFLFAGGMKLVLPIEAMTKQDIADALGRLPAAKQHCASLAIEALRAALTDARR